MTLDTPSAATMSPDGADERRSLSLMTWLAIVAAVVCVTFVLLVARRFYEIRRYYSHVDHVHNAIRSFHSRCPADVPDEQWTEAVEWTANVIVQDFFAPSPQEWPGLQRLARELDERAKGEVDLHTLQWIWDQCADACGGPNSFGIKFRRVKLLTNGPITDTRLPEVWSLSRCRGLDLSDTQISDASIPYLSTLTQLERFDIRGTDITAQGAEQLRQALPGCEVFH